MRVGTITIIEASRIRLCWHFFEHYRRWCEPEDMYFVIMSHKSPENDVSNIASMLSSFGCKKVVCPEPFETNKTHELVQRITRRTFNWEGWHFSVDSDEFFDRNEDVNRLCALAEAENKQYLMARMVDRVAPDGEMPEIPPMETDIYEVFPHTADLTQKIQGGYPIKACLLKNPLYGLHHAMGARNGSRYGGKRLWKLDHFKWDASLADRMKERVDNPGRFPYHHEFARVLKHIERHGKLDLSQLTP